MQNKISRIIINKETSLTKAMNTMNKYGLKCLILVNNENKLFGSLSDGDIRKYLVKDQNRNVKSKDIARKNCISVTQGKFSKNDILKYFNEYDLFAIPEIDNKKNIQNIFLKGDLDDIKLSHKLENYELIIMAGGLGKRIGKFTEILPKALLPIKNKTIISKIMESYNEYGLKKITVSINDKSQIIKSYLNQYKKKYSINYLSEKFPLGTVGSLSLLKKTKLPIFLTNCDIYSNYNKLASLNYHIDNKNDLTIIVSNKSISFDYGVCKTDKYGILKSIHEKPIYSNLVLIGQYILNPKIIKLIPKNIEFNMNQLLDKLLDFKFKIGTYRIDSSEWVDIGQWNLYKESIKKLE